MTNKKIKIALLALISLLALVLFALVFLPININCNCLLVIEQSYSYALINKDSHNYIQSNKIEKVTIPYSGKKYSSEIFYVQSFEEYYLYNITLPSIIYENYSYLNVVLIIDVKNIYTYWL